MQESSSISFSQTKSILEAKSEAVARPSTALGDPEANVIKQDVYIHKT